MSPKFIDKICFVYAGHIAAYSSSSKANTQHGGSYTKYTELLHKHQRSPQGPMDLYHHPLTTSQMYGWWMSHGQPHTQDWAQAPKHVHVNSEMTRYQWYTVILHWDGHGRPDFFFLGIFQRVYYAVLQNYYERLSIIIIMLPLTWMWAARLSKCIHSIQILSLKGISP